MRLVAMEKELVGGGHGGVEKGVILEVEREGVPDCWCGVRHRSELAVFEVGDLELGHQIIDRAIGLAAPSHHQRVAGLGGRGRPSKRGSKPRHPAKKRMVHERISCGGATRPHNKILPARGFVKRYVVASPLVAFLFA
jgi:hypothetical protein